MDNDTGSYEFDSGQNDTVRSAARWTGGLAWIMIVSAGLLAVGGAFGREESAIGAVIASAMFFFVGLNLRGAAKSMRAVVQTAGNDLDHLMVALARLSSAFRVMGVLLLLGVLLYVVATVMLGAWMASVAV